MKSGDKGVVFSPEAKCAFLIVSALHCFSLIDSTTHTEANMRVVWVLLKAISSVTLYYYKQERELERPISI